MAYGVKDCLQRLGGVLIGRPDPSLKALHEMTRSILDVPLKRHYDAVVSEPVPERLSATLRKLNGGGHASH